MSVCSERAVGHVVQRGAAGRAAAGRARRAGGGPLAARPPGRVGRAPLALRLPLPAAAAGLRQPQGQRSVPPPTLLTNLIKAPAKVARPKWPTLPTAPCAPTRPQNGSSVRRAGRTCLVLRRVSREKAIFFFKTNPYLEYMAYVAWTNVHETDTKNTQTRNNNLCVMHS